MDIIYLSGKITGLSYEEYMGNFDKWERYFTNIGFNVINPVKLLDKDYKKMVSEGLSEDEIWNKLMRLCIVELMEADTIFLMENFMDSKGACLEFDIAESLSFNVINECEVEEDV